jgi:hypothetical protein
MPANPFEFLLDMPEREGRMWLSRYLLGEATDPSLDVPFDVGRLEFLLGEVARIPEKTLPARVAELAGGLLAEAVMATPLRDTDPRLLRALFILVEALPVSDMIVEFLTKLAISGPLLPWPDRDRPDFHLLTLRALVLHQRPSGRRDDRLVEFWKHEAQDPRYASVAIQGLLRVSPVHAIDALPDFVERALGATPPIPLANLLFALTVALNHKEILWRRVASLAFREPKAFGAIRDGLRKIRLPDTNPRAWDVLEGSPRTAPRSVVRDRFGSAFVPAVDPSRIFTERQRPIGTSTHPRREQRHSLDGPWPPDDADATSAPQTRDREVLRHGRRFHQAIS